MTPREYAKANRHIGEAWEDGKTIEYFDDRDNKWIDWTKSMRPVFCASAPRWRIKPEPTAPKFRPWKPEEVPFGAVIRPRKGLKYRALLVHAYSTPDFLTGSGTKSHNSDLIDFEYKWPHEPETAWRPCGVEVKE